MFPQEIGARTVAKQFAAEFEDECAPFQCALKTVLDETVIGWNRLWTKMSLDETIFG